MVDGRVLFQNPPDHTRIGAGGAAAGPSGSQTRQDPASAGKCTFSLMVWLVSEGL